jgi:tetratricopeptide (TPR) repeat protein/predicted Ser/Thr protein kinase
VRTPAKGDSSSSGIPSGPDSPSDSPTLIDIPASTFKDRSFNDPSDSPTLVPGGPGSDPSDSPTLIDNSTAFGPDAPTMVGGSTWPVSPTPTSRLPRPQSSPSMIQPGTLLGQRYEILQILGEGGMGAVYKARDRELNRMVALKVIRPELAGSQAIIDRFKQELLLATQVTHKNVIRIYDLSEAEGMKFITMEFVEGEDLRSLMQEKKKLAPEEAVEIMLQVCRALEAAHSVGIIHRDLKPQNIMRDKSGRILVMDFGLARTLEGDGMTQTGALVGTMDYMSPEQALGKDLDQRSDLFTLGLIFYELLTGKMPYKADSVVASLLKRTQERAAPVSSHDASIPRPLSDIVSRCMDPDVKLRYESSSQIMADLEAWQGGRAAATLNFPSSGRPWGQTIPWHWIGGAATVLALALTGFLMRDKLFKPAPAHSGPLVSLAILPFRNASGDPGLDWYGSSIAEMLTTDVGQSASLRTVSPDRVHQILNDLHMTGNVQFDPNTLRQVSESGNADTLISGQFVKFGDQIRIDATLQDLRHDRRVPLKIDAANEKDVPNAIDRLAELVRQNLSVSSDVIKELQAQSFRPSTISVDALRSYNEGLELSRQGKDNDALNRFQASVQQDPEFALAYAKLGQTYSSLGYDSKAEQAALKAEELSANLPARERYLIVASHARVANDNQKAIQYYTDMAKVSPEDTDVQFALGSLYELTSTYDQAREHFDNVLKRDPQNIDALLEIARVEIKSGNASKGLEYLNRAYSLATQSNNQDQTAASLHVMGLAYEALNKPEEALENFQKSLKIKREIGQLRGAAASLSELGNVQAQLGKAKEAQASFEEALKIRRDIGDKRGVGATLLDFGNFVDDRGDHDQALKLYKESLRIQQDIGNESLQAICLNNIGGVYSEKGQHEDALTYFQQALQLREKSKVPQDIVEAVHNLGEASVSMGRYDEAIKQYMRALDLRRSISDNRGAAIESYSLGTLFDYQGRFGAAVNAKQDALKTFRDLKDRTFWMAEMLGGYGEALILAGRGDEAKSPLDEALSLARELKNDGMVAQALGFQGDSFFYRGDFKSAHSLYTQALQSATRSKEPDKILLAKASLARVEVQEKRSQEAISSLRPLVPQADELGLKYTSVESSIFMAEAMIQNHDYAHARQELDGALLLADKLGQQPLSARAHYLLALIAHSSGNNSEAQDNYRQVLRLLDAMKKDPGAENILQRADFKAIYDVATSGLQATK